MLYVPGNAPTAFAVSPDYSFPDVYDAATEVITAHGPSTFLYPKVGGPAIEKSPGKEAPPDSGSADKKPDGAAAKEPTSKASAEPELKDLHAALWEAVEGKPTVAKSYFDSIVSARTAQQASGLWKDSAQQILIEKLAASKPPENGKADESGNLLRQLIRANAGLPDMESSLYSEAVATETKRNLLLDQAIRAAKTLNDQLDGWKTLRNWAIGLMIVGTLFAIIMTIWLLKGRDLLTLDSYLLPVLIFIFAVMAVSPAVLLLLGRPLAGIDQFMPAGEVKAPSAEKAAEKPKEEKAASK